MFDGWKDLTEPSSTSLSMLDQVRIGDPCGWQRLVRLYSPLVYWWARDCSLQPHDAADVLQEVFASVVAHIEEFRRERNGDTFRGWLWTITRNRVRDVYRRRNTEPQAVGGSNMQMELSQVPEPEPVCHSWAEGISDLLHRALEEIRGDFATTTWSAFWRASMEGQTSVEIAADLGMNPNAVRQAIYRVRRRLRIQLGDARGSEKNVAASPYLLDARRRASW